MAVREYILYRTKIDAVATSNQYFVLVLLDQSSTKQSVWFDVTTGDVSFKNIEDITELDEVGKVYGYIGKIQINETLTSRLLFIKSYDLVGSIKIKASEHNVYRIKEILMINLAMAAYQNTAVQAINPYNYPEIRVTNEEPLVKLLDDEQPPELVTISSSQSATSLSDNGEGVQMKQSKSPTSALSSPNLSTTPNASRLKFEKKILDEVVKLFQDNNGSFYFSPTFDLTNSIERQQEQKDKKVEEEESSSSYWRKCDDRFFWNKVLLNDLINHQESKTFDDFILPLIQGFVEIFSYENQQDATSRLGINLVDYKIKLKLCLISRRNRFRLGTRFRRRGIDENGNVANFVETEQILDTNQGHTLSYVVVRGSIPLFWSQPGIKYRPAPRIDRNFAENTKVCQKHFDLLEEHYPNQAKSIIIINLVEESGKESLLGDSFVEQLAEIDKPNLTYVQFDFHEHCKGLKFENVSILKDRIIDLINKQMYCWVDEKGFIFKQNCLFRVNCVDCLDRTNVVEMVISKCVLENQLARLGIIVPPTELPFEFKKHFQLLWANNGDAVSQQYAGTSALKGDFTRTGERNLAGLMKDGVKSANRFYLRFKENYRLLAYEVLQGVRVVEEDVATNSYMNSPFRTTNGISVNELNSNQPVAPVLDQAAILAAQTEREENIKQLVLDCRKQLVDINEDCYGSWALIDSSETADSSQLDPDVVLLFTSSALYVSNYDDERESFIDYQKIPLKQVERLELGPESSGNIVTNLFKSPNLPFSTSQSTSSLSAMSAGSSNTSSVAKCNHVLRIYYRSEDQPQASTSAVSNNNVANQKLTTPSPYFHSFRSSNLRFFNNMVITAKSNDEVIEALRGICHTIQSTALYFGADIQFEELNKLPRKKSKPHKNIVKLSRLSTKLTFDELEMKTFTNEKPAAAQQVLNDFGKLISDKLLGMSSKTEEKMETDEASSDKLVKNNSSSSLSTTAPSKSSPTRASTIANSEYLPRMSQKQYTNRYDKINDTKSLIVKDTRTNFIFI